jgi:hypothetical protein
MSRPNIIDVGAGSNGIWGKCAKELWPDSLLVGVEAQLIMPVPEPYDVWITDDYLKFTEGKSNFYDVVIGNPPFSIANQAVFSSLEILKPGGHLMLLLRLSFAAGQFRRDNLFRLHPPKVVGVYSRRISWYGTRKTNTTDYGLFIWEKGYQGSTTMEWIGS